MPKNQDQFEKIPICSCPRKKKFPTREKHSPPPPTLKSYMVSPSLREYVYVIEHGRLSNFTLRHKV
jgi:hypothetical protein